MISLLQDQIENRLGVDLQEWIVAGRIEGRSWRHLATQVNHLTGHKVTAQTLHNWYAEVDPRRSAT